MDESSHRQPRQKTKPSAFAVALVLIASISSLLGGYETGITAAALISIGTSLSGRPLTSFDKSMITSSPSLFALFASPVASVLADRIGRKQVLLYASLLFIVGSLLQATAPTVGLAILGRSILGLSSGASGTTVPVYIVETAPPLYRGTLVTASILLVIVGQMLGFGVAGICAVMFSPSSSWRWTVAFGIGPALLQAGLIFFVMPDTPRWLIMVGRLTTAERVVQALYGDDRDTLLQSETMFEAIQRDVKAQQEERQTQLQALTKRGDWRWIRPWKLLLSQARYRRAMTISCLLVGLQQFCGFRALLYYSTTIFVSLNFRLPSTASLIIALTNFLFTLLALVLIDRVGRRRTLLFTLPLMIIALLAAASAFSRVDTSPETAPSLIFASLIFFVAAFALGLGNVPAMQSELYPLAARALGSGVAMGVAEMGSFVVGLTFLPLMEELSPAWTLKGFAGVCALGLLGVWAIYPETARLTLEEAGKVLERSWAVR